MWASGTGSKVSSTVPNTSSVVPLQLLFGAPEHSARLPQLFIFFLFGALSCQSIKRTEKTKLGGGARNFLEFVTENELLQAVCSVVFCFPDFDMHVCNLEALQQCRWVLLQSS